MRVLITSIVDPRRSAHSRLHEFVRHLSSSNELTILSLKDSWKDGQRSSDVHDGEFEEIFSNIKLVYLTESNLNVAAQELLTRQRIRRLLTPRDMNSFDLIIDYNTILVGKNASSFLPKVPRIYDLADDVSDMVRHSPHLPLPLKFTASRIARLLLSRSIRSASYVTSTTGSLLNKYGVPASRSMILPNGVPSSFLEDVPVVDRIEVRRRQDEFVLCYVGVLREWVDFDPVLTALSRLNTSRRARLVVIGEEGGSEQLMENAKAHGVSEFVTSVGTVPHSHVRRYLSGCDCGLIPFGDSSTSLMALPLKLFEYFSCGLPVLSTNVTAIKELFPDEVIFYDGDSERLYRELMNLVENPALGRERANRARNRIKEEFTWESILRKLDDLILHVTG